MSTFFNADEILEIAEQIERNGAKFYRLAAEKVEDIDMKRMLLKLAVEEDQHKQTFEEMKKSLSETEKKVSAFDLFDRPTTFLKAWANGHVFDLNIALKKTEERENVIEAEWSNFESEYKQLQIL